MALDDAIQILTTIKNALTTAITTADASNQSGEFSNAFEILRTAKYHQARAMDKAHEARQFSDEKLTTLKAH